MPERIIATRTGLVMALAYTLPLLLWLLWQASLSNTERFDPALSLRGMLASLLIVQSSAIALCTPWLMRFSALLDRCCALAMLVLVPGPLYAIAGLSATASTTALLLAMLLLAGLAVVIHFLYAACLGLSAPGNRRSILMVSLQVLLLALCWHQRELWQTVLST
jgi:hypothetical protein